MTPEEHQNKEIPDIKFNIDEFDIENYDFKPLTEGLGFHKDQKKKAITTRSTQGQSLPRPSTVVKQRAKSAGVATLASRNKGIVTQVSQAHSSVKFDRGLEAFYRDDPLTTEADKEVEPVSKERKVVVLADSAERVMAFFLDYILIFALTGLTFYGFSYIAEVPIDVFMATATKSLLLLGALLHVLFFLFYFSVLDIAGTVGKRLFGITLESVDGKLGLGETFLRSLIVLFSIPLLGLPIFINLQDKLTDTRVIRS
jgi:uncharacterized RDD family membrane protein YckC